MSEIKIKCPTCGKILRLENAPNIDRGVVTCPVCQEKHIVGKCERYIPSPPQRSSVEETQYGNVLNKRLSNGDETLIQGNDHTQIGIQPSLGIGKLVDGSGKEYSLQMGINTIGRRASSSNATMQIETADRYMSRQHAIIDVRNAGGQMIHIIKNYANKNPSYLNGTVIGQGDQLVLNDGDMIKLGMTELTFKACKQ